MQTRGVPSRNRREASDEVITVDPDESTDTENSIQRNVSPLGRRKRNNDEQRKRIAAATTAEQLNGADRATSGRTKRDVPGCITNHNAQRQLLVGCTQPNVIEVRPQCNDDGDEGTSI